MKRDHERYDYNGLRESELACNGAANSWNYQLGSIPCSVDLTSSPENRSSSSLPSGEASKGQDVHQVKCIDG